MDTLFGLGPAEAGGSPPMRLLPKKLFVMEEVETPDDEWAAG